MKRHAFSVSLALLLLAGPAESEATGPVKTTSPTSTALTASAGALKPWQLRWIAQHCTKPRKVPHPLCPTAVKPPATAPVVSVAATDPKELIFSWAAVPDATHYRLRKDARGTGDFQVLADSLTGFQARESVPVHLHDWPNARYIVDACNKGGCTSSLATSAFDAMNSAIGYFKGVNTNNGDAINTVAVSGDGRTLAMASQYEDSAATGINGDGTNNAALDSGAVYVYAQDTSGRWVFQGYVKPHNTPFVKRFGMKLALSHDGNTLAVGTSDDMSNAQGIDGDGQNNLASQSGAVWVFSRAGANWTQQAYIKAPSSQQGDLFGGALGLSADGNRLLVGSPGEDGYAIGIGQHFENNLRPNTGAAFLYERSGSSWSLSRFIKPHYYFPNTPVTLLKFGDTVAISSDGRTLAVGAKYESGAGSGINPSDPILGYGRMGYMSGAVFVYHEGLSGWQHQAYIKPALTYSNHFFGHSIALSGNGDTLVVGSTDDRSKATGVNGNPAPELYFNGAGAAWIFRRQDGAWSQQAYLKPSFIDQSDNFGHLVDVSDDGSVVAVSAPWERSSSTGINGDPADNRLRGAGAGYLFRLGSNGWEQTAFVKSKATDSFCMERSSYCSSWQLGSGLSLSADGKTLAIGAEGDRSPAEGINGNPVYPASDSSRRGAVFLY